MSPNKIEAPTFVHMTMKKEVNKEYNKSTLMVEEEVLRKSLVKFLKDINIVLEESYDIISHKPLPEINLKPTDLPTKNFCR
jgi:hypothetical protein